MFKFILILFVVIEYLGCVLQENQQKGKNKRMFKVTIFQEKMTHQRDDLLSAWLPMAAVL